MFEPIQTDHDQMHPLKEQSARSLIKSVELENAPINELISQKKGHNSKRNSNNLIEILSKKNRSSVSFEATDKNQHGPKYRGKRPDATNKDESPQVSLSDENFGQGFSNAVWQSRALEIWMIVLRFISFITKSNFATSFRLVNHNIFQIIGDRSANYRYYLFNDYFKNEQPTKIQRFKYKINQRFLVPLRTLRIYKYFMKNSFVMRPESAVAVGWNIYILAVLNINVLYVSSSVCFHFDKSTDNDLFTQFRGIIFDVLPSYSFIMEIILKFNTCYYYRGNVIEDRYNIARNYLRSSFFFDICVVIPFFVSLRFNLDYLNLVLILKVFQIRKFSITLFDRLELSQSSIAIFDLCKLCYTILAAAHFCACLWFLVGSTGSPGDITWAVKEDILDRPWIDQYLTSFYFAIITMTTIGYGDITPQTLRERTFTIAMAVVAVGVFGYSIGNISNIFAEWQRKSYEFRSNMNELKKYMRVKGYNKVTINQFQHLQEKVRKYYEYLWSEQNEENDKETRFVSDLPTQLQDELKIDINMKVVKNVEFITRNFSEAFQIELSKSLIEEKFGPDQNIYVQNQVSEYFYILERGKLQFYIELKNKSKQLQILETMNVQEFETVQQGRSLAFGQLEFMQNQAHPVSCKSSGFSYVLKIHKDHFIELLKQNQADHQRYFEMKDQVLFCGKSDIVQVSCKACSKVTHFIKDCPMVCGYPNRAKVLLNYRRNIPQDRVTKYSRYNRRLKAVQQRGNVENSVYLFMCKNETITDGIINQALCNIHLYLVINDELESISSEEEQSPRTSIFSPVLRKPNQQLEKPIIFDNCNEAIQDPQVCEQIKYLKTKLKKINKYEDSSNASQMPQKDFIKSKLKVEKSFKIRRPSNQSQLDPNQLAAYIQDPVLNKQVFKPNQFDSKRPSQSDSPHIQLRDHRGDSDDSIGKIRGQYEVLFDEFEKYKNYDRYLRHNNPKSILNNFNNQCKILHPQKHLKLTRKAS